MTQVRSDHFRHDWVERWKASWDNSALVFNPAFLSFPHMVSGSHRFAPALSLAWTFLYLLFFRLATWFGLPAPTPFANAIQLLLTLKVEELNRRKLRRRTARWRLCFLLLDGEFSQRGAKLPRGKEEGCELFWKVSSRRGSVTGAVPLRPPLL